MIKRVILSLLILQPLTAKPYPSEYVWSLGYALASDINPFPEGLPFDFRSYPPKPLTDPKNYVTNVKDGDVVWIQSAQLEKFYREVLPTLTKKVILIVSDGDHSFPSTYRSTFEIDKLIDDERIIHIFAQNVDYRTPQKKVSGIPIGIDFHSVAHFEGFFGEPHHPVKEQEEILNKILQSSPPTAQRKKRAIVDFHLSNKYTYGGLLRSQIFDQMRQFPLLDALSHPISRHPLWKLKGQYAFSISPHGIGLDCHRTWEDLALGCIVIVKTSPLDVLYDGLPVVIVKDWSELTEANFDKWLRQYGDASTNPQYRERLKLAFWMDKIRSAKS